MAQNKKDKKDNSTTNPFRRAWNWWKKIARKIGDFNARVILTLFYLVPLLPFALAVRAFTDPLQMKKKERHGWHIKEEKEGTTPLERAQKQF
ncbi:MAG: hypothetical protein R3B51_10825 [Thermodesulfobacteriota bacterium]